MCPGPVSSEVNTCLIKFSFHCFNEDALLDPLRVSSLPLSPEQPRAGPACARGESPRIG